ncbi:hypothetical protein BO94DRAFT_628285 [Aspergillus sclerotioniger CBS 115572]|uniref:Uncharacterized protein n=1 Tax=Aspergillus sclerotioniger CBS 115572 TaxID=1450535 RepID=A0A317V7G2_9EURO|nr:hypothetical protein BO94DRAFT_628285 [Aspergillus sclerotioniger CBS 115572]PWY70293.1 hypothetical protein BO94DRAFT_628285 [Aspergillus sclerotioniger CBS 115572]
MPRKSCMKRLSARLKRKPEAPDSESSSNPTAEDPLVPSSSTNRDFTTETTPDATHQDKAESGLECKWGNLWDTAYECLRLQEPDLIEFYENWILDTSHGHSNNDLVGVDRQAQVKVVTENKLRELHEKQLVVRFKKRAISISEGMRRVVHRIVCAKDVISVLVANEPHAAIAWAGVLLILPAFLNPMTQKDDATSGLDFITDLLVRYHLIEKGHSDRGASGENDMSWLKERIVSIYTDTLKYQVQFVKQYSRTIAGRYLRDLVLADNWNAMIDSIRPKDKLVLDYLQVQSDNILKDIKVFQDQMQDSLNEIAKDVTEILELNRLSRLEPLQQAAYNARKQEDTQCLEGTQVDMLTKIEAWIDDPSPSAAPIFWLHGMAGTGKSTIARTVASRLDGRKHLLKQEQLRDDVCLGGTFFFKRSRKNQDYAGRFFSTLAWNLAEALPELSKAVCEAIGSNLNIASGKPVTQWRKLILEPLQQLAGRILPRLTIFWVIDALDECLPEEPEAPENIRDDNNDIQVLLDLLKQVDQLQDPHIKVRVFLTSRPTRDILRYMPSEKLQDQRLLKVPLPLVNASREDDITRFFKHRLKEICQSSSGRFGGNNDDYSLDPSWPGPENIKKLVNQADGLFIFAATACRFLQKSEENPEARLNLILASGGSKPDPNSPQGQLDKLYHQILRFEVNGDGTSTEQEREARATRFKTIVGTVIVLSEELSVKGLSGLLSDEEKKVKKALLSLQSMINISEADGSIELLHLSFRDFLVDQQRCGPDFLIDEKRVNQKLFECCIDTMSHTLKKNICQLERVNTRTEEIQRSLVDRHLPEHVRYACCQWAYHFQQTEATPFHTEMLRKFLQKHFSHWIEAMAIMDKMPRGIMMLRDILKHTSNSSLEESFHLSEFVRDAERFTVTFRSAIEQAPLQLYASALLFTPKRSIIRERFEKEIPSWIVVRPSTSENWSPLLQSLQFGIVLSMAFSPDNALLALESEAGISIWDTTTWKCVQSLAEDTDACIAMSFSPDSISLATFFRQRAELWHLPTGVQKVLPFSGFLGIKTRVSLLFSSDGKRLMAVNGSKETHVWDLDTWKWLLDDSEDVPDYLELPPKLENSPDGSMVLFTERNSPKENAVEGLKQSALRLWTAPDKIIPHPFQTYAVDSLSFSPDGRLRYVSPEGSIRFWDPRTKAFSEGINTGPTERAVFSPEGSSLIAVAENGQVWTWKLASPASCTPLDGFSYSERDHLVSVVAWLAPDSGHVAIVARDGVWVWEASTGKLKRKVGSKNNFLYAISPDGKIIAGVQSGQVRIWGRLTETSTEVDGSSYEQGSFITLSPDGTFLITQQAGATKVWNTKAKTLAYTFRLQEDEQIFDIGFSQGTMVIVTDLSVIVLDTIAWMVVNTLDLPVPEGNDRRCGAGLSPNAGLMVSGVEGASVKIELWNLNTRRRFQTVECNDIAISLKGRISISEKGDMVAATIHNKSTIGTTCAIWNITTGVLVKTINDGANDIAFSPTDDILALQRWAMALHGNGAIPGFFHSKAEDGTHGRWNMSQ